MAPEADVSPEHIQQLMGHAGLKITDTTYLKRNAPALSAAADKIGTYIAGLLAAEVPPSHHPLGREPESKDRSPSVLA